MAYNCKDCDRLQVKQTGTAPERPPFQQPTMYDHFENFQKFKQSKENEQFIKHRNKELLKFNSNFTDFNSNDVSSKNDFEQFSIQDIEQFRKQLRVAGCDRFLAEKSYTATTERETTADTLDFELDSENDEKSLQKRKSLLSLTRTPIQCPISVCSRTLGVTSLLSHFLRDHSEDFGVPCQDIYLGKRAVLIFDPTTLEKRENVCLGVLAYGGNANESSTRPAERSLCLHNAFLPKPHEHLDAHLPILIMTCRTSWSALAATEVAMNSKNPNYITQELLVIWLASVQTTKPIHGTVTVYDKSMSSSQSAIIKVRNLNDSQNPQEFLLNDTNFIRLSYGEINQLSKDRTECIHMEIMINEYDQ